MQECAANLRLIRRWLKFADAGFAGDFGTHQVTVLVLWRFYTAILLTVLGGYALIRNAGYRAATQLLKVGWVRPRKEREPPK